MVQNVPDVESAIGGGPRRRGLNTALLGILLLSTLTVCSVAYRVVQERLLVAAYEQILDENQRGSADAVRMRDHVTRARACFEELRGSWGSGIGWDDILRELIDLGPDGMEVGKIDLDMEYGYIVDADSGGQVRGAPSRNYDLVMAAWIPPGQADRQVDEYRRRLQGSDAISRCANHVLVQGMQIIQPSEDHPNGRVLFAMKLTFSPVHLLR